MCGIPACCAPAPGEGSLKLHPLRSCSSTEQWILPSRGARVTFEGPPGHGRVLNAPRGKQGLLLTKPHLRASLELCGVPLGTTSPQHHGVQRDPRSPTDRGPRPVLREQSSCNSAGGWCADPSRLAEPPFPPWLSHAGSQTCPLHQELPQQCPPGPPGGSAEHSPSRRSPISRTAEPAQEPGASQATESPPHPYPIHEALLEPLPGVCCGAHSLLILREGAEELQISQGLVCPL